MICQINETPPNSPLPKPPVVRTPQLDQVYVYEGTPLPEKGLSPIRRGTPHHATIFGDDLRATTIANLVDNIHKAYDGWDMAVKFKDDGMQSYYMKYIVLLQSTLEKVKKI